MSFQFQACLPTLVYIKDLRQAAHDSAPIIKAHASMHSSTDVSTVVIYAMRIRPAPGNHSWVQKLRSAISPNYPSARSDCPTTLCSRNSLTHVHKFCLNMCVCPAGDKQQPGPSHGLVLPQSMPPAALPRPNQSPANNRVQWAACRRPLPLSFTSQEVSVEICVVKIYMLNPILQRTVPFC